MGLCEKIKAITSHFTKKMYKSEQKTCDSDINEDQPLSTENITFSFCDIGFLTSEDFISLVSDELKVPYDIVEKGIARIVKDIRKDVICCVEYPYVDTYYRDTYYSFYSRKHSYQSRYCFRISFFSNIVNAENFYEHSDFTNLFHGYMVLRPTVRRVIGYTFLSPLLFEKQEFVCCLCKKNVSVYGRELSITGFPFCGQDGEALTCAETSLIMIMDYFSHKYNKYSQLLPSQVLRILSRYSNERQLPSRGLPSEMLSFVLRKLGFGIRIYTRQQKIDKNCPYLVNGDKDDCLYQQNGDVGTCHYLLHKGEGSCPRQQNEDTDYEVYSDEEFKRLLYIYIESGFPIIVCTSDHTYLVIGKENKLGEDNIRLVTINDNLRPFELINYDDSITSFIVPLYGKIFLDAEMIQIDEVIKSLEEELRKLDKQENSTEDTFKIKKDNTEYIYRYFLTTSKSYKEFVTQAKVKDSRELFVSMAMPHFIWVCEMIDAKMLDAIDPSRAPVSNIMIFDATEGNSSSNYFIMAKLSDRVIVRTEDNSLYRRKNYKQFKGIKDIFYTFDRNLKGKHSKWQE